VRVVCFLQALHQVAGGALLLLSLSKGKEVNKFAVLSAAAGLLALVVGELGDISVLTSIALIPYVLIFSTKKELDRPISQPRVKKIALVPYNFTSLKFNKRIHGTLALKGQ
jgi:hypothetical protein